jgi:hypothetical protein
VNVPLSCESLNLTLNKVYLFVKNKIINQQNKDKSSAGKHNHQ